MADDPPVRWRGLPQANSGAHESDFRSVAAGYFWNNGVPPESSARQLRLQHRVFRIAYSLK